MLKNVVCMSWRDYSVVKSRDPSYWRADKIGSTRVMNRELKRGKRVSKSRQALWGIGSQAKTWKEQVTRSRTNPMKSCKARAGNQGLILDSKKGRKSMQSAEGCLPPLFTTQYQISVWKTMKGYSTHPRGPHLGILKKSLLKYNRRSPVLRTAFWITGPNKLGTQFIWIIFVQHAQGFRYQL